MIDFMAGDPDAVVEPWQPKVGQRVRVTAAVGECPMGADDEWDLHRGAFGAGAVGVVERLSRNFFGHDYYVALDLVARHASSYAACELEPA